MKIGKSIWHGITSKPYRLQLLFDIMLLILSPVIFISIIGFDTKTLDMDVFIVTLVILIYIYITRWFSHWYCKRRENK
ncbi:hypothetical protein BML2531_29040 [Providencia rettgeri]|nr:hypothetical protein DNK63_06295 [Providencia rettgeri]QIF66568.1 hypothetical protein FVA72_14110 [Providencia sp. 1709051003]BBV05128.1 hypothetical protein BML2531_29040 [Providencia rettgeri]